MRFLQFSFLPLATVFLITGCGGKMEDQRAATVAKADKQSGFRETASADMAASKYSAPISEMPEAADSAPAVRFTEDSIPATGPDADRAVAKTEPARRPKPADERFRKIPPESKPAKKPQTLQAGTLTAGSLNDHKNLDDYREYLSTAQQSAAGRNIPPITLGERVMIEVLDGQGNAVSDVEVTVTQIGEAAGENEGVLLDTYTRADGKTFFASGWDAKSAAGNTTFELTVRPPKGEAIIKQVDISQSPWVVELPNVTRQLPLQLDLALVVDTTQSMADELNYLKVELDNIVARVHRMFPNVEQRYALVVYRDEGDDYVVRNAIDFTNSLPDFRAKLAEQTARGGGDIPEAMHLALENANKLSWRRDNTARVMFLVADAPPHHPHVSRMLSAVGELRNKGVAVYPLAGSGPMEECEFLMRAAAFLTRGQYLFLTDHSGVGNPHAKPTAAKYEVEPLNQLMIRMIASELSGKPVLAQEIIATEESDGGQPPTIPQEQNQPASEELDNSMSLNGIKPSQKFGYSRQVYETRVSFWESTTFRCFVAVAIIGAILLIDNRLRT